MHLASWFTTEMKKDADLYLDKLGDDAKLKIISSNEIGYKFTKLVKREMDKRVAMKLFSEISLAYMVGTQKRHTLSKSEKTFCLKELESAIKTIKTNFEKLGVTPGVFEAILNFNDLPNEKYNSRRNFVTHNEELENTVSRAKEELSNEYESYPSDWSPLCKLLHMHIPIELLLDAYLIDAREEAANNNLYFSKPKNIKTKIFCKYLTLAFKHDFNRPSYSLVADIANAVFNEALSEYDVKTIDYSTSDRRYDFGEHITLSL